MLILRFLFFGAIKVIGNFLSFLLRKINWLPNFLNFFFELWRMQVALYFSIDVVKLGVSFNPSWRLLCFFSPNFY